MGAYDDLPNSLTDNDGRHETGSPTIGPQQERRLMTARQPMTPTPTNLAQRKQLPETNIGTGQPGQTPRRESALYQYAFLGRARSNEDRRAGVGDPDYLDRLAEIAPEDWDGLDAKFPDEKKILRSYVSLTFERLQQQNKILTSRDGGYSAFNTGLSTPRQETIYGLFRKNQIPGHQQWRLQNWYVERDRVLRDNFPALPDFATYTDNPADYIYDWRRELVVNVRHVLEDNLSRFPDTLRSDLYGLELRLKAAVDLVKKRVRHNYKAAVPCWYTANQEVQLLLPLSLTDPAKVDLALVVSRRGDYYRGDTVLTTGMAYNNARLLARPDGDWLRPSASLAEEVPEPTHRADLRPV
jgi:hypothetical protein